MAQSDIRGNVCEVRIDQTLVFTGEVRISPMMLNEAVTSGAAGATVLAVLHQHTCPQIQFTPYGLDVAMMRTLLGLDGSGDAPLVGSPVPVHELAIHPVAAADHTQDLCFFAVSVLSAEAVRNGTGPEGLNVTFQSQVPTGQSQGWRIGDPATLLGWA